MGLDCSKYIWAASIVAVCFTPAAKNVLQLIRFFTPRSKLHNSSHSCCCFCLSHSNCIFKNPPYMLMLKHKPTKLHSFYCLYDCCTSSLNIETAGFLLHHNLFDDCLIFFCFIIFLFLFFFDLHSCSSYCFSSSSSSWNCAIHIVVALLKPTKTHEIWA